MGCLLRFTIYKSYDTSNLFPILETIFCDHFHFCAASSNIEILQSNSENCLKFSEISEIAYMSLTARKVNSKEKN